MTTWSIDYAFMNDTGDLLAREGMERVGWGKTRDCVDGDPWIAGKSKDDIDEFGYGGALVRIKSDQEPATANVQRAVIAKRGNAPIPRTRRERNQEGLK